MKVTFKLEAYPRVTWGEPDTPGVAALWRRFRELFERWEPVRKSQDPKHPDYLEHELEAEAGDADLDARIAEFQKSVEASGAAGGHVNAELIPAEMKRARYVPFGARSLEDPEDESPAARNAYPPACDKCEWPDLAKVPEPYWVSREVLKRPKEELFSTPEGLLVARPRTLAVLRAAIGGEIEVGPALVVGQRSEGVADVDRLWWVRAVHALGPAARADRSTTPCAACGRPLYAAKATTDAEKEAAKKAFNDWRLRVTEYGGHAANLVRLQEFMSWQRAKSGGPRIRGNLAISGSLFEHLKAMKVKGGILNPAGGTGCILSARAGEPPLEAKPKSFAKPDAAGLERATPKPAVVATVDATDVRRDVEASWERIDAWLKVNAPRVYESLAPGATDAAIKAVESKLKMSFPEDVKASWRVHDGGDESDLLPSTESEDMGHSLLSLKQIARDFKSMRKWSDMGWQKGWLPIATNGGGDYQCVDLAGDDGDPATRGRLIEFRHEESDYEPVAKSLADRLRELADGLESGKFRYDETNGIEAVAG